MDPNNTDNQTNIQPPTPIQSGPPVSPLPSSPGSQPPPPPPPPPPPDQTVPPEGQAVVTASPKSEALPVWFYILFAVVAIVFLFITFLLIQTIMKRQSSGLQTPTGNTAEQSLTAEASPTVPASPSPTSDDEYLEKAGNTSESDDVTAIEADLESTDIKSLKEDLQNFSETVR